MSELINTIKVNERYLETARLSLSEKIERLTAGANRKSTEIVGLTLHRYEHPTQAASYMMPPSICVISQGSKRVLLGSDDYVYDANNFLITSVELPLVACIIDAKPEAPYLGLTYNLDPKLIAQLMVDSELAMKRSRKEAAGIAVSEVTLPMLNAFLRLLDLLDEPEFIPVVAPLIHREILFRLLVSDQGPRLREIGMSGSREYQIARAIDWLKGNYAETFKIDELAAHVRMSSSSLHQHFREMTNMSPLQYQKWLRLHEAKRLMLTENIDANSAAFNVGYESPSQFSREYRRLFGEPPLRDIKKMSLSSAVEEQ